jgi:hypothetical protein
MWKVAASLGPGTAATAAQAALPAASKVLPYARWIALGTSLRMYKYLSSHLNNIRLSISRRDNYSYIPLFSRS